MKSFDDRKKLHNSTMIKLYEGCSICHVIFTISQKHTTQRVKKKLIHPIKDSSSQ